MCPYIYFCSIVIRRDINHCVFVVDVAVVVVVVVAVPCPFLVSCCCCFQTAPSFEIIASHIHCVHGGESPFGHVPSPYKVYRLYGPVRSMIGPFVRRSLDITVHGGLSLSKIVTQQMRFGHSARLPASGIGPGPFLPDNKIPVIF